MTLDINLLPKPENCKDWNTNIKWSQSANLPSKPFWLQPSIWGDVYWIRGVLEGLADAPIEGFIEIVIHEGMLTTSGKLNIHDDATYYNFKTILYEIENKLIGLAAQFTKTRYRVKGEYFLEFIEEPPV